MVEDLKISNDVLTRYGWEKRKKEGVTTHRLFSYYGSLDEDGNFLISGMQKAVTHVTDLIFISRLIYLAEGKSWSQ